MKQKTKHRDNKIKFDKVFYLPSGRVFTLSADGYIIECTEMRDVSIGGKEHFEVRESLDPHIIWKHLVDYRKKWLLTVSTQKGCPHNCKFCDVAPLPFKGNLSLDQIVSQIDFLLRNTDYVKKCDKAKIGFARMGEPAHNLENVLRAIKMLPSISEDQGKDFNWLPCFNTILPVDCIDGPHKVLYDVIEMKERHYNGNIHVQISCNTTNEEKRKELFNANVLEIEKIVKVINATRITNRTITLNFIVMQGYEIEIDALKKMGLSGDKFAVKLIPLNKTIRGDGNELKTVANYNNYERLIEIKKDFESNGIPVVIDAIAKCEEAGLCCGQLVQIFR